VERKQAKVDVVMVLLLELSPEEATIAVGVLGAGLAQIDRMLETALARLPSKCAAQQYLLTAADTVEQTGLIARRLPPNAASECFELCEISVLKHIAHLLDANAHTHDAVDDHCKVH